MSTSPLRAFAAPLRTLDPDDTDFSDLGPARDLIGDARVVSIGESAHGVSEFYQLKDRLFRYLVSELGFTAFVMESGFSEGLAVNDWVLGGGGDLDHIAHTGITYGFGDCAEMRAQLQWMRDWNTTHDRKVHFYGMDVPGSNTNPGPAIAACLSRLDPHAGDADLLALAELGGQFEAMRRYADLPSRDRERLSSGVTELAERATASGDDVTRRCAKAVKCLDDMLTGTVVYGNGCNPRDELMADNVRWILGREARIVIGAHNGHIQRSSQYGPVLGQMLASALGDDMIIIGTTFASGNLHKVRVHDETPVRYSVSREALQPSPDSIDAFMDEIGLPLHFVDLRRVPDEQIGAATRMLFNHDLYDFTPKGAFDALIHVRQVTNVTGLLEATRDALARAEMKD